MVSFVFHEFTGSCELIWGMRLVENSSFSPSWFHSPLLGPCQGSALDQCICVGEGILVGEFSSESSQVFVLFCFLSKRGNNLCLNSLQETRVN